MPSGCHRSGGLLSWWERSRHSSSTGRTGWCPGLRSSWRRGLLAFLVVGPALEGVAGLVIGLALSVGNLLAVNAAAAGHVVGGNGLAISAVEGYSDSTGLGGAAALGLDGNSQGIADIDRGGQGQVVALFIALGGNELVGILPSVQPAVGQNVADDSGLAVDRLEVGIAGNGVALVVNDIGGDNLAGSSTFLVLTYSFRE